MFGKIKRGYESRKAEKAYSVTKQGYESLFTSEEFTTYEKASELRARVNNLRTDFNEFAKDRKANQETLSKNVSTVCDSINTNKSIKEYVGDGEVIDVDYTEVKNDKSNKILQSNDNTWFDAINDLLEESLASVNG